MGNPIVVNHKAFAPASEGPFECEHCAFFKASNCHCELPEEIHKKFDIPDVVAEHDCCDFFKKNRKTTKFTAEDVRQASGKV